MSINLEKAPRLLTVAGVLFACVSTPSALGQETQGRYCTATANTVLQSCKYETYDDYYKARAICINLSETGERQNCNAEANQARSESLDSCSEQHAARLSACQLLGEARYDPEVEPYMFDSNFANPSSLNPYFPLKIGNRWELKGGGEVVAIEVLNRTKLIDELTCVVVRDRVMQDGQLREDTDDWFAQKRNGDVFYCGEEVKDYETFDGDRPRAPELVSRDGSFKHDRDGDVGGTAFLGRPVAGVTYRQEFSVANAEDMAQVVATNYRYGMNPMLDRGVPQALANLLCGGDCIITKEFSSIEPGKFAYKYYARGIGFFLEIKDTGEKVQLTSCNFDGRCAQLPQP